MNSPSRLRLLCIGYRPSALQLLRQWLESCGFQVVVASPGLDALMQYTAHDGRFFAILTFGKHREEIIFFVSKLGFEGLTIVFRGCCAPTGAVIQPGFTVSHFFL